MKYKPVIFQQAATIYSLTINQEIHLYNFHLEHFKTLKTTPTCCQIIIREFRLSLLKLLYIHDFSSFF